MKHYYYIAVSLLFLLLRPCDLSAQRDVETILHGNSYENVKAIYGEPLEYKEYEGESGVYFQANYPGFSIDCYKADNTIENMEIWSDEFCVLSSVVPGGIKVGDHVTKYRDVDFTKIVTGKHYEDNGLIPIKESDVFIARGLPGFFYNYKLFSRGRPYLLYFATKNGIIGEIFLDYLEDYTFEERADIVFSAQE